MAERRAMGIEQVLSWAYRDELPKSAARSWLEPVGFGLPWGSVERWGEMLAEIDGGENVWGLAPDLTATAGPHPDAERIGAAVLGLDGRGFDLPEGWNPLGDLVTAETADLVGDAVGRAVRVATVADEAGTVSLRATPRHLVTRYALLRVAPCWAAEVPEVVVESANGKPRWFRAVTVTTADGAVFAQEVDGYDRGRKRPYPGAYRKRHLVPDPVDAAVARAEYEVWRAALDVLAEDLAGLETIRVLPCERAYRPWMAGEAPGGRVLPCLLPVHNPEVADVSVGAHYARRAAGRLTRGSRLT